MKHPPCPFCKNTPRYLDGKIGFHSERVICGTCGYYLSPDKWSRSPAPAPDVVDERAAFEKEFSLTADDRKPSGGYYSSNIESLWDGWQARAALSKGKI